MPTCQVEDNKSASKARGDNACDDPTAHCPAEDQIRLVELVEVVKHAGKVTTQPPNARKQYINLDDKVDAATPHPDYGRVIRLRARVEWVSGDKTRPLTGKQVFWYYKPDAANRSDLTGNEKEGFDSANGVKKKQTATDAQGWTPIVEFVPSLYGGDKFEVFATDDPAYKDGLKAGAYEVWRQFWYQVTEMKRATGGGKFALDAAVTTQFEASYAAVYIKMTEAGPRKEAAHVRNLETHDKRNAEGKKYFVKDDKNPFKCHLVTVDHSHIGTKTDTVTNTLTTASWTTPNQYILWPFDPGTHPWKVSAKYRVGTGAWTDIPDANLSTVANTTTPGWKKIKVDFTGSAVTPSAAKPVEVSVQIKQPQQAGLGWGGGSHHLYLCTGFLEEFYVAGDRIPVQKSDAVHEIGHALGLVNMPPAAAGSHNAWDDAAHPSHCRKPSADCAMYYGSSPTRSTGFHLDSTTKKGCHDHLRRQDFSRKVMENHWKD